MLKGETNRQTEGQTDQPTNRWTEPPKEMLGPILKNFLRNPLPFF